MRNVRWSLDQVGQGAGWCLAVVALVVAGCGTVASEPTNTTVGDVSADVGGGDGLSDASGISCGADNAGLACDDGDKCTQNDKCTGGACVGAAVTCADDITCTTDSCDKAKGCVFNSDKACVIGGVCVGAGVPSPNQPCRRCQPAVSQTDYSIDVKLVCDDGEVCTQFDTCKADGTCAGTQQTCNDSDDCTLDSCTPGSGCKHDKAESGACDDGNPCSLADSCAAGKCLPGKEVLVCDDANPCTSDLCEFKVGCKAVDNPKACDDSDGCTIDSCDPVTGCKHVAMKAGDTCSNGDLCKKGETCDLQLKCTGGSSVDCNDKNICTTDFCKADKGCIHAINENTCDDGQFCTFTDVCTGGQCIGVKSNACPKCSKIFSDFAGKLTQFQIGTTGNPGDALNVDGDKNTCAPDGNCSEGVDNAAAVLAFVINQPLSDSIVNGLFTFVAEFSGYQGENVPFTLNLYYASMNPESKLAKCDSQKDVCKWDITQSAFTAACTPKFTFPDAIIKNGVLTAGGANQLFAMDAQILGAKNATLYVKGARIESKVTFSSDGKAVVGMSGALGGAVPTPVVVDIINAMDDSVFASLGGKANALELVKVLLTVDIDSDGDGEKDASSIGLRFSAIGAKLVGTEMQ